MSFADFLQQLLTQQFVDVYFLGHFSITYKIRYFKENPGMSFNLIGGCNNLRELKITQTSWKISKYHASLISCKTQASFKVLWKTPTSFYFNFNVILTQLCYIVWLVWVVVFSLILILYNDTHIKENLVYNCATILKMLFFSEKIIKAPLLPNIVQINYSKLIV